MDMRALRSPLRANNQAIAYRLLDYSLLTYMFEHEVRVCEFSMERNLGYRLIGYRLIAF